MLGLVLAILFLVAVIAAAVWTSRSSDNGTNNGDNLRAAQRYGPGSGL